MVKDVRVVWLVGGRLKGRQLLVVVGMVKRKSRVVVVVVVVLSSR